jgi:hypothetical protein
LKNKRAAVSAERDDRPNQNHEGLVNMTQADSVHSKTPLNASSDTRAENYRGATGSALRKNARNSEEAFQAILRLRKAARTEIDRLVRFLDESDNQMELEPDGTEAEEHDDPEDDEPSLRANGHGGGGAICYTISAIGDGSEMICDREGDEHDGGEPDPYDEDGADAEPSLGLFDRMIDQHKSWRQTAMVRSGRSRGGPMRLIRIRLLGCAFG